jgi:hypothetical protein
MPPLQLASAAVVVAPGAKCAGKMFVEAALVAAGGNNAISRAVFGVEILGRGSDTDLLLRRCTVVICGGDGDADLGPTKIRHRDGGMWRRPRPTTFEVGRVQVVLCHSCKRASPTRAG